MIPNLGVEPGAHLLPARARGGDASRATRAPYELTVRDAAAPAAATEREPNDDAAHATASCRRSRDASGFFGRRRDEDWLTLAGAPACRPDGVRRCASSWRRSRAWRRELQGARPARTVLAEARARQGRRAAAAQRRRRPAAGAGADRALRAVEGQNAEIRWALRIGVEPPLDGAEREPNDTSRTPRRCAARRHARR